MTDAASMGNDGWLAQPAELFPALALSFDIPNRDVVSYARYLREGSRQLKIDLFPAITTGRGNKYVITPRHAGYLFLALATSPAAMTAAEYAAAYGSAWSHKGPLGPDEGLPLIDYVEHVIRRRRVCYRLTFYFDSYTVTEHVPKDPMPALYFTVPRGLPLKSRSSIERAESFDEFGEGGFSRYASAEGVLFERVACAFPAGLAMYEPRDPTEEEWRAITE